MDRYDVTIIGAGVSGLTCARHLLDDGFRVQVLEARGRVGGRAYTQPLPTQHAHKSHPPELGAEFIHGAPKSLMAFLNEQKVSFIDVPDGHLFFKNGKLVEKENFWEQLESLSNKLNPKLKQDRPVAEFLKIHGKSVSKEIQSLFVAYVEGFQAADLTLMGERALALNEQAEEESLGDAELFRPEGGYTALLDGFVRSHSQLKAAVVLNATAKSVRWQRGAVEVDYLHQAATKTAFSKAVVMTLPVGVLKSKNTVASISWHPEIPELQLGLQHLEMGHVQRIAFEFKTRFWESLSEKRISFIHTGPEQYYPTWWTQLAVRSPYLMAWQGGPKALELSQKSEAERIDIALKTLSKFTRKSKAFLTAQLVQAYSHDWSQDPYSLGAYSYTGLLNEKALARLQKPFANTVFFAGEAINKTGPAEGTIHGALESGERAAKLVARSLHG